MLSVFIDTLMVVFSNCAHYFIDLKSSNSQFNGGRLTQYTMTEHVGHWGNHFILTKVYKTQGYVTKQAQTAKSCASFYL